MRLSTIAGTTGSFSSPPSWVDNTLGTITYGVAYSDGVEADGNPTPTYSISAGALPTGLSLNSSTGAVTGTPNTAGSFSWTITATNTAGTVSQAFSQTVGTAPSWTDNTLAAMSYGVAYSDGVSASGTPTPTYSVSAGALPGGISLNSTTGAVTGTPNTAGSFSWTITATNGAGSVSQAFSQTIVQPIEVQYVIVAGGGGVTTATDSSRKYGGGAGGGGYRSSVVGESSGGGASAESIWNPTRGTGYTVTVGGGGSPGNQGGTSRLGPFTSTGGGYGGGKLSSNYTGGSGGSGGGGGDGDGYGGIKGGGSGTSGQGYAGGNAVNNGAGGGGGAGQTGRNGVDFYQGGNGGNGVASSITGSSVTRAGGGGGSGQGQNPQSSGGAGGGGKGGSTYAGSYTATSGTANTGGGGGGPTVNRTTTTSGGSGIVIIKFPTSAGNPSVGAGLAYSATTSGSYRIYTFTSGSGTITWS